MARTITEIKQDILDAVAGDGILNQKLTSTSHAAIWRLWAYIVAFAIYLHEVIVEKNAENSRPHTLRWYHEVALEYMDGYHLTWKDGQFKYDITGLDPQVVADAKVVDYVAITEAANGVLVIKTAKDGQSGTQPLDAAVHTRFTSYMGQVKDAGNRLDYINAPADELQLEMTVWVDDLIIDMNDGSLLQDPQTVPVDDACMDYLGDLPFNGAFVKTFLTDKLQGRPGIKIPKITGLKHREAGAQNWNDVPEYVLPYAGHFHYISINVIYKKYNEVA